MMATRTQRPEAPKKFYVVPTQLIYDHANEFDSIEEAMSFANGAGNAQTIAQAIAQCETIWTKFRQRDVKEEPDLAATETKPE
jgi:hypothetical protein